MFECIILIGYIAIGSLIIYDLWKDGKHTGKNKDSIISYIGVWLLWPVLTLIGLIYGIVLYLKDIFGPHGGCAA